MKNQIHIIPYFRKFISESSNGRRLKKDGSRISAGTISNYKHLLRNLENFEKENNLQILCCKIHELNHREFLSEKNYWKKFYNNFTNFLYHNGCHDNYVGQQIKILRTFFNYLKAEKNIDTGEFYKNFHITKEEISILVLSPERLSFLINDTELVSKLSRMEKVVKDMFVFGCTTGIRFSDLNTITVKNFKKLDDALYFEKVSIKTKTATSIKLPIYAIDIFKKYKSNKIKAPLFPTISLNSFNEKVKSIGELSGFTEYVEHKREVRGVVKNKSSKDLRFCDKMSSHMMRRTAVTTLLILGMPELIVRRISGHKTGSKAFYRYIDFAKNYTDHETEKAFDKLSKYAT